MNESPEEKRLKPKLVTRGKFFLALMAILLGSSLLLVREYLAKGSVSALTLGASLAALVIGLIILVVLSWYANKPEE